MREITYLVLNYGDKIINDCVSGNKQTNKMSWNIQINEYKLKQSCTDMKWNVYK